MLPGGAGDPDRHVVAGNHGRQEASAGGALALGHGEGRRDDHDAGMERSLLMHIVDLVYGRHGPVIERSAEGSRGQPGADKGCPTPTGDPADGAQRDACGRGVRPAECRADPIQEAGLRAIHHGRRKVLEGKRREAAGQDSRDG